MPSRYPLKTPTHASPRPRRFCCENCHIKIEIPHGKCDDCENKRPFIQYDAGIGDDRFYRMQRPNVNAFADVRESPRNRRGYKTRVGTRARGRYSMPAKLKA